MTAATYHPNMDAGELREYIAARHATHLVNGGSSEACHRARRMVGMLARQLSVTYDEVARDVIADFEAMEDLQDLEARASAKAQAAAGGR